MPTARYDATAVITGSDTILLMGGYDQVIGVRTILEYQPSRDRWRQCKWCLPLISCDFTATYDQAAGTLMLLFTSSLSGFHPQPYIYILREPLESNIWIRLPCKLEVNNEPPVHITS